jgi:hypothetical protein
MRVLLGREPAFVPKIEITEIKKDEVHLKGLRPS